MSEVNNMTENVNTDFVTFFKSLDDNNPCSSCELRRLFIEMMNNTE